MTQLHAVLVGIDAYRARPLHGCVNDVDAVRALLVERAGVPPGNIQSLASPHPGARRKRPADEAPATLANLRTALAELTRRARRGDRILIYYSGHGMRVACAHPAGYTFHREALAPVDLDDTAEHRLLFDHEINEILAGLAGSVTCIFDCCHSAGLTRNPGLRSPRARSLDPLEDLRWDRRIRDPGDGAPRRIGAPGALAACHLVAACLGHEKALETTGDDGVPHGLLTSALLRTLGEIPDAELWTVPWVRIWQAMRERVEGKNPWQHLQMTGHPGRAVLAGPPVGGDPGLSIRKAGDAYEIDAGTLASITRAA
ncbi:MAG TPA: caspase family protein, partial [Kofleriaceae bacterium]|nr:caspase family protein [Kofleriaceae bacterium]